MKMSQVHLKSAKLLALLMFLLVFVIQCEIIVGFKTEIEITPAPTEEVTTKKSGWFGGIKNFFRSSDTTTTTTTVPTPVASVSSVTVRGSTANPNLNRGATTPLSSTNPQKPPPLVISHAPFMPLGPRPETPSSSPFGGDQHKGPQWPLAGVGSNVAVSTSTTTTVRTPLNQQQQHTSQQHGPGSRPHAVGSADGVGGPAQNLPPGFAPYRPQKPQPSGFDLSYGGGGVPGGIKPGAGLATPTTSTTVKPIVSSRPIQPVKPDSVADIDLRFGGATTASSTTTTSTTTTTTTVRSPTFTDDSSRLSPGPGRRPSVKEDFPPLPSKSSGGSPTPVSPFRPSSPTAWQNPLPTPSTTASVPTSTPSTAAGIGAHGNKNGVSFVPHSSGTTTTVRPGYSSNNNALASDDEIRQLTEQLYTKEANSQINLITVNIQGKTRSIDSTDEAPQPLLNVDDKALEPSTIAKMKLLFNNYEQDTLVNEHVTPNERKEENEFLDAVMATNVMRHTMLFLQQKGVVNPDPKTHRDLVKELWFTQYSRGQGKIGSSGFEHVFVHEVKNGTIIGFHNWVYVNQEEQANRFDYKGYLQQMDLGTKGKVLKLRFEHNGLNKPVDTMFIGTSPELELALYTLCFQLRPDRTCPVSLGNSKFGIVTYSWRYRGKNLIGSAYPEI